MPLNPAYQAAQELQKKLAPKFCPNKEEALYCILPLLPKNTVLTMAGTIYQPERTPHISIYQYYKKSEAHGLSVFHYTWYGFVEENNARNQVVLHVYFDKVGRCLYSQLKNQKSKEVIQNISTTEEKAIQKHAKESSQGVLGILLQHISASYCAADADVNRYLSQLEELSKNITSQLLKYKNVANLCIAAMQQKNIWTFGSVDLRSELLINIVAVAEKKLNSQQKQNTKGHGFYSPAPKKQTKQEQKTQEQEQPDIEKNSQKQKSQNKNVTSESLALDFHQKLAKMDKEIDDNEQNTEITEAQRALVKLDLLNKKFSWIQGNTAPFLENELIKALQRINSQHKTINLLFREKAYEGNIEAITSLRPFISGIDFCFFAELLRYWKFCYLSVYGSKF